MGVVTHRVRGPPRRSCLQATGSRRGAGRADTARLEGPRGVRAPAANASAAGARLPRAVRHAGIVSFVRQRISLPGGDLTVLQPSDAAELPDDGPIEWAPLVPYGSVLW